MLYPALVEMSSSDVARDKGFLALPLEIIAIILEHLDLTSLVQIRVVCSFFAIEISQVRAFKSYQ